MTEISLAWLLTKVTSPVVGMTKPSHVTGALRAVDLTLTQRNVPRWKPLHPHAWWG